MSSIYLAELVGSASGLNEQECEQSRSARSSPSPEQCLQSTGPECPATPTSVVLQRSSFEPTESRVLVSSAEGSPAKTSVSRARVRGSKAKEADSGSSMHGSYEKLDRVGSLLKTYLLCALEGMTGLKATWKEQATPGGRLWLQLETSAPRTSENESGLWRTPHSQLGQRGTFASEEAMQKRVDSGKQITLQDQVAFPKMWPTPTAADRSGHAGEYPKTATHHEGLTLATAVLTFPTPTANRRDGLQSHGVNVVSGALNPTWVEWLMGFPLSWTALEEYPSNPRQKRKAKQTQGGSTG